MKINYGIIAVKPQKDNNRFVDIVHFCGYENKPTQDDMRHFRHELEHDEEFGIGDKINDVIITEASGEIIAYYRKKFEENK